MTKRGVWLLTTAAFVALMPARTLAQGSTTAAISGVVLDTAKGVIPGASVVVTSNATGTKYEATTNTSGAFSVPALSAGTYTVTVSLAGFKHGGHHRRAGAGRHSHDAERHARDRQRRRDDHGDRRQRGADQHADANGRLRRSTSIRSRRSRRRRATC